MEPTKDNIPEDHLEIAEKIRSGEYFREARAMYDFTVHDPMVERYMYVLITSISILIFLVAFFAAQGLLPLQRSMPFIVTTTDIVEEVPSIRSLISYKGEDPSEALLRYVVSNYVMLREEYNIDRFDRSVSGVKSQSAEDVFETYQRQIDPRNPNSPITLYQRHSVRRINILSTTQLEDQSEMEVIFEAMIEGRGEVKRSRWQANIAFKFDGVTVDQDTGYISHPDFIVTEYRVKRLQDIK